MTNSTKDVMGWLRPMPEDGQNLFLGMMSDNQIISLMSAVPIERLLGLVHEHLHTLHKPPSHK